MVSKEKKFIFVHIPKTGGNSIQTVLKKWSKDRITLKDFDGVNYHKMGVQNTEHPELTKHSQVCDYDSFFDLSSYCLFTVIRNPYERMLSWFMFDHNIFDERYFIEFIDSVGNSPLPLFDSQYKYCLDNNGNFMIDYTLRYENLKMGFETVCGFLDIPKTTLPRLNHSKNSLMNYRDFYTDEAKEMVEKYYEDDINLLGYTYE